MAVWWIEQVRPEIPFPIYKNKREACKRIAETLGFEELNDLEYLNDDILDAYVAHRLAVQFMSGECRWIGDACQGGFILPDSAETKWGLAEKVKDLIRGRG